MTDKNSAPNTDAPKWRERQIARLSGEVNEQRERAEKAEAGRDELASQLLATQGDRHTFLIERDEARAERDQEREFNAEWELLADKLETERDEARAEIKRLAGDALQMDVENKKLKAMLRIAHAMLEDRQTP